MSEQSADAKTAMVGTLCDMKDNLAKLADPRSCAKRHPWLLVGSAVAAGIVAGAALSAVRPKKAQVRAASACVEPRSSGPEPAAPPHGKPSWVLATLGTLLVGALSTLVQTSIAAAFAANSPPPHEPPPPHKPQTPHAQQTPCEAIATGATQSVTTETL